MKSKNLFYVALLLVCTLIAGARADIKYTQTTTTGEGSDAVIMMHMDHFVASGKERNETVMGIGNFNSKEAIVTICQPHQVIHIDDHLKIYAIEDENSGVPTSVPPEMGNGGQSEEKAGTGKIAVNVKVTDLKPEKVASWDTKHYMVEMHTQSSGCVGDSSFDLKMELWVADVKDAHGCKESLDYGALIGRREGSKCKVTYDVTGDFARFAEIQHGLVMRQKMFDKDGKVMMVQEVTSLSQAKLDDSVFVAPKDYTKLSLEDYTKRRQQAMMQAMMNGGNNNASDDDDNNNDQKGNRKQDQDKTEKGKQHGFHIPGLPF